MNTIHGRIAAYLDDVARMLGGLDPTDRAEVLAGLREHLDAALADGRQPPTDQEVDRVLLELGPPEKVAAVALADLGHPGGAPAAVARPPVAQRGWVPALVAVLLLVAVVISVLVVGSLAAFVETTTQGAGQDGVVVEEVTTVETDGVTGAGVAATILTAPLWLSAAVLLLVSPLFSRWQKVAGALLVPVGTVVLSAGTAAVVDLVGLGAAAPAAVGALVVVLFATVVVLRAILHTGRARAQEIETTGRVPAVRGGDV